MMTSAVDDRRTARVRLLRSPDGGFSIECEILVEGVPPAVHGPFALTFTPDDDGAAVAWFATHIAEPPLDVYWKLTGPTLGEPDFGSSFRLPPLRERSVTVEVPAGFILPLVRVFTPCPAPDAPDQELRLFAGHSSGYRPGIEQWLPKERGPGILQNEETGEVLACEGIRLLDERRASVRRTVLARRRSWVIGARAVEIVPVGGPAIQLALLSPPMRVGDEGVIGGDPMDESSEPDLLLETSAGTFLCRSPLPQDLPSLSRVEPHLPDWLGLELDATETNLLLLNLAAMSAKHRDANGALGWSAFCDDVIASERVEVLIDEDRCEVLAVRYRRAAQRGGAIFRTLGRAERRRARWDDAATSLWELARVGWTQEATIAIRPSLVEVFAESWANDVVGAVVAEEHVHDLGDVWCRGHFGPHGRDMVVEELAAFLGRLSERVVSLRMEIKDLFEELPSMKPSHQSEALSEIDHLTSQLRRSEVQELLWRRWMERSRPDELPVSSDELARLLWMELRE